MKSSLTEEIREKFRKSALVDEKLERVDTVEKLLEVSIGP